MSTNLDQLYSPGSVLADKVNALSRNTVKNNIQNQQIPQQMITQAPSNAEHIIRLHDTQYVRVVNQTTQLSNPNSVWEWTVNQLTNQRLHDFIIKVALPGVDYVFNWSGWIQDKSYKNMGPTLSFAKDTNFNETVKVKVWVEGGKFKMMCNQVVYNCLVYLKVENHR